MRKNMFLFCEHLFGNVYRDNPRGGGRKERVKTSVDHRCWSQVGRAHDETVLILPRVPEGHRLVQKNKNKILLGTQGISFRVPFDKNN